MSFEELGYWVLVGLLGANVAAVLGFLLASFRRRRRKRKAAWFCRFVTKRLIEASAGEVREALRRDPQAFLESYIGLCDSVDISEARRATVSKAIAEEGVDGYYFRRLFYRGRHTRSKAAIYLGYMDSEVGSRALAFALEKETLRSVKLHIIYSLCRLGNPAAIPSIVDCLAGQPKSYQDRVLGMLLGYGERLAPFINLLMERREEEIIRLVVRYASRHPSREFRDYLLDIVRDRRSDVAYEATRVLMTNYVYQIDPAELLGSDDTMIRNLAAEALGSRPTKGTIDLLHPLLSERNIRKSAIVGISRAVNRQPALFGHLMRLLEAAEKPLVRDGLLEVVSTKVDYFLGRPDDSHGISIRRLLEFLIDSERTSGIIAFLNRNNDGEVASRLVSLLRPLIEVRNDVAGPFRRYLKSELVDQLGLTPRNKESAAKRVPKHISRPALLSAALFLVLFAPPTAYVVSQWGSSGPPDPLALLLGYGRAFGLFFAFYALVLNLSYLLLLVVSGFEVRRQQRNLDIKPLNMLFHEGMLPSVTIVAPAFREEETIAESVNSLLNLRYPDYEVIVVNDGSTDRTLEVLVEQFELERTDVFIHGYLQTKAIRGVYKNPRIPELLVIDKENGGKADSLNAGINAATKEYFAGIDSDSLLERDALLRLTAQFLDEEEDVVATGGNIFPVNGCSVERGHIDSIGLPSNLLARFQTVEYIRSFMAGRTAWSRMKSLLIISGAFGLFRKADVVEARGYLTGSEAYGRDTVGEDMELVVRISRLLRAKGKSSLVRYCYSANCWTEVPERLGVLRSQRDRWQRGLIEIMLLHRIMLFRPKYGMAGAVGMPYFLVFEVIGPWIEIQGYLWLVLGVALGLLSPGVLMLMFALTIPMGILVSIASLILAEWHTQYFRTVDRAHLLLLAFMENFGYRQYVSLLRVRGYISALRRQSAWGSMGRRGFKISKGTKR